MTVETTQCTHGDYVIIEVWYGKPPYYYVKKKICKRCFAEQIVEERRLA